MEFTEFFDVNNTEHMAAFSHLQDTGAWPEGFVPEGCRMGATWSIIIQMRMARAFAAQTPTGDATRDPLPNSTECSDPAGHTYGVIWARELARSVRVQSASRASDISFNFCPRCGADLRGKE